jgi:hypothetical protein
MVDLVCISGVGVCGFYECFSTVKISVNFSEFRGLAGQILYQIRIQIVSPGLFLRLSAVGLDSTIPGPGQFSYQISTQNVSPGVFLSLGAFGLDFLIPGPGQILYQISSQNVSPGWF